MEEFRLLDAGLKKDPLPVERKEFEDRAELYGLLRHIEEFIQLKMEFSRKGK